MAKPEVDRALKESAMSQSELQKSLIRWKKRRQGLEPPVETEPLNTFETTKAVIAVRKGGH